MRTGFAIALVRWVTLLLAQVVTVLAVLEIYRLIHYAREIKQLLERALPAAQGIAAHTRVVPELASARATARDLALAAQHLERNSAALASGAGELAGTRR